MPTPKKNPIKKVVPSVLPIVTPKAPTTVSSPPDATSTTTTGSTPVWSTTPPDVTLPLPPTGFVPVILGNYRGAHPKAGELTALPDAVAELESTSSYVATFGASVPHASTLAVELATASEWTKLRVATESFLLYAKSLEAITWKTALADLEKLDAVFQVVAAQNPALIAPFPATERLLDVRKSISARGAASRAKTAKATKAKAASAASGAVAAVPVIPVVTGSGTGGGVTH
jgi:hypothetical protein